MTRRYAAFNTFVQAIALMITPILASQLRADDGESPFLLSPGFTIEKIAEDRLVHDCFSMTVDPEGHPVVSGPNYIKTLIDDDNDGNFDRSIVWTTHPKQGAQGLWAEKNQIYWVSDSGLWMSEDGNGDYVADRPPRKILDLPTGGEHDAHAIRRGPDGYWYLVAGNFANNISRLLNSNESPIAKPRAGTLWRISPDFSIRTAWSHGMRNCYDFDFLPDGQIVTFDSDDERESVLPWYRPTRVMVLGPGSDAGWCGLAWKDHDSFITMPQVIGSMGRSSPTGVAVYQHHQFPSQYSGAVFVLDWAFGRILTIYPNENLPEAQRAENRLPAEVFLQTRDGAGFAPTAICVSPQGYLWVCVGGRGTAGSIYQIRPTHNNHTSEGINGNANSLPAGDKLKWLESAVELGRVHRKVAIQVESALSAPNPWDAWSVKNWSESLDRDGHACLLKIVTGEMELDVPPNLKVSATPDSQSASDANLEVTSQPASNAHGIPLRAAQLLTRLQLPVPYEAMFQAMSSPRSDVHAAAWWIIGRGTVTSTVQEKVKLPTFVGYVPSESCQTPWERHLGCNAERLKWEAAGLRVWSILRSEQSRLDSTDGSRALRRTWLWAASQNPAPIELTPIPMRADHLFAKRLFAASTSTTDTPLLDALAGTVPEREPSWNQREAFEVLASIQVALGDRRLTLPQQQDPPNPDVLDGYRATSLQQLPLKVREGWVRWVVYILQKARSQSDEKLISEAARTLALLEPSDHTALQSILSIPDEKSHPTSDINTLCSAAQCTAKRNEFDSQRTAAILSATVRKVSDYGLTTDSNWPKRIQQLLGALTNRDPQLGASFVKIVDDYSAEDLQLLQTFGARFQSAAKEKMRARFLAGPNENMSAAGLEFLLGGNPLDAASRKSLNAAVRFSKLRKVSLETLSKSPTQSDYESFVLGLESDDPESWRAAWKGIQFLSPSEPAREFSALARIATDIGTSDPALPIQALLSRCRKTAKSTDIGELPSSDRWEDWKVRLAEFSAREGHEEDSKSSTANDRELHWQEKWLAAKDLSGDSSRGKVLFEQRCKICHSGSNALGPSLSGVSKRFSSDDLANAIFIPSKDISDRYRAVKVLTTDDVAYTGMVSSEDDQSLNLLLANGETVVIDKNDIQKQAFSTESIMPKGLLDNETSQDVSNLLEYLRTLQ